VKTKKVWEVEKWDRAQWIEQTIAELAFTKRMGMGFLPSVDDFIGSVVGYVVRRASMGCLVLVPSDRDDDVFVAVAVREEPYARCLGWLRGSEGKRPEFYNTDRWSIDPKALHSMDDLPAVEYQLDDVDNVVTNAFEERPPGDFQRGYLTCLIDQAAATEMSIEPRYRAMWRAIRKEAGLNIDPATAEVTCIGAESDDPRYFARSPGGNEWVSFDDLPEATAKALWEKYEETIR